jgi:hypothetical protein
MVMQGAMKHELEEQLRRLALMEEEMRVRAGSDES